VTPLRHLSRSSLAHALFALVLLVRGMAVPGYMAGGDGWPVQLCPEGLAPSALTLLFGAGSSQHSHHSGPDAATNPDESGQPLPGEYGGTGSAERCMLGGSTAPALLPSGPAAPAAAADLAFDLPTLRVAVVRAPTSAFQARGPPHSLRLT